MGLKITNNAFATLASSISDSVTSITVASGQGARFPSLGGSDYFYATLVDISNNLEIIKCTARSGDVLTVERAQDSTTARAYTVGDRLEIRPIAAMLNDILGRLSLSTWTIEEISGSLYFKVGGVSKAKLDASGNLTVVGDVTAFGTI
jgi:hypothetical protein